ncbi:hypothetical protein OOZ19_26825 [Saccharopolyspora sp. NFXS83]|nr:hypothetical protein [Saccharopolyspora sp. NFXS83]MCX2733875.1 hypothetical protein [Saccharopolyspora sp. NFXS83]
MDEQLTSENYETPTLVEIVELPESSSVNSFPTCSVTRTDPRME